MAERADPPWVDERLPKSVTAAVPRRPPRRIWASLQIAVVLLGCGALPSVLPTRYAYFQAPNPTDPWTPKIRGWQTRERQDRPTSVAAPVAPVAAGPEALRLKYEQFRSEHQRAVAREVAAWIQTQAPAHYIPDGAFDHWATTEETLEGNGDDCDGLELLVFHFLRDMGLGNENVYRAIVHRPADGQHHMVTLWFEDPSDPWVIDPTGAMTRGMPKMSEVPGWVPLKIFSEEEEFSVRPMLRGREVAQRDKGPGAEPDAGDATSAR